MDVYDSLYFSAECPSHSILFVSFSSSTLTCPSCGKHSRTFDPYLCVSLPLPEAAPRVINVIVVAMECVSQEIALVVQQTDSVGDLRAKVADGALVDASKVFLSIST